MDDDEYVPFQFHEGEIAVQALAGTTDLARETSEMIAPFVPDGARAFIERREFAVIASVDSSTGHVWASVAWGTSPSAGFPVRVASPLSLRVTSRIPHGDPLRAALAAGECAAGVLFIDLATRKRFRVNGIAAPLSDGNGKGTSSQSADVLTLEISVKEAFPNCPKYINRRYPTPSKGGKGSSTSSRTASALAPTPALTDSQRALIESADAMFLATYHACTDSADASHRGGRPGFVRVLSPTAIAFPDYLGNGLFQSLGNIAACPRAGVTFVDWVGGSTLQLSGTAQIHQGNRDFSVALANAGGGFDASENRWISFQIESVVQCERAVPFDYTYGDASPYNPPPSAEPTTCDWVSRLGGRGRAKGGSQQAQQSQSAGVLMRVDKTVRRTPSVISFTLTPADASHAHRIPRTWRPGQYAIFSVLQERRQPVVRTWTISSPSAGTGTQGAPTIEVTIKRKDGGLVSTQAHSNAWAVGSTPLEFTGIAGEFSLFKFDDSGALLVDSSRVSSSLKLPNGRAGILLLGGGAGMTPHVSTVRALASMPDTGLDVVLLEAASTPSDIIFSSELGATTRNCPTPLRLLTVVSRVPEGNGGNHRIDSVGRIDAATLERLVPDIRMRRILLCGPPSFMTAVLQALATLRVAHDQIDTEKYDY